MLAKARVAFWLVILGVTVAVVACGPGNSSPPVILTSATPLPGASITTTGILPAAQATTLSIPVPKNGAIGGISLTIPALGNSVFFSTTVQSGGSIPASLPPLSVARAASGSRTLQAAATTVNLVLTLFTAQQAAPYQQGSKITYIPVIEATAYPNVFSLPFSNCYTTAGQFAATYCAVNLQPGVTVHAAYFDGTTWHDETADLQLDNSSLLSALYGVPAADGVGLEIDYNYSGTEPPITFQPNVTYAVVIYATIAPSAPVASPSSVTLTGTGSTNATTIGVSETGYTGAFTVSGCSGIATASVGTAANGSTPVTITGTAAGTCSLTIADASGGSVSVPVTVVTQAIIAQPTSLTLAPGQSGSIEFIIEGVYGPDKPTLSGSIASSGCSGIASASTGTFTFMSGANGRSPDGGIGASVQALGVGTCSLTASSSGFGSVTVPITVVAPVIANPTQLALPGVGSANQGTFTASQSGYTGAFTATNCLTSSGNTTLATTTVAQNTPQAGTATVTVTPLTTVSGVASTGGSCTVTVTPSSGAPSAAVPVTISVTTVTGS